MNRKVRTKLYSLLYKQELTYLENQELINILETMTVRTETEETRLDQAKKLKEAWISKDPDLLKDIKPREVTIDGKEFIDYPRQHFCKQCTCIYGSYKCHEIRCLITKKPWRN